MSENSVTAAKNTLGQDDFFKLLVTQLRYQNPLEPLQDQEFIAQLATFSSLEQMTNLNKRVEQMTASMEDSLFAITSIQQATSCLGKVIEYRSGKEILTGKVDTVRIEEGLPILMVGDTRVDLSSVIAIKSPESEDAGEEGSDEPIAEEEMRGVPGDSQ